MDYKKVYKTKDYGDFIVIGDLGRINHSRYVRIKFLNTSYEKNIRACRLNEENLNIYDPHAPSVYGVGYMGNSTSKGNKLEHSRWVKMLSRCYNKNAVDYNRYGGIGVRVDPRWFSFENYLNDIKLLPNYDKKCNDTYNYQLDKDYLQMNIPKSERVYSKDTCIWATINDNINYRTIENKHLFKNKYYGVTEHHGRYITRVGYNGIYKVIGSFSNPIYAANAYNQYKMYVLNDYSLLNDVEYVSVEEYSKDNSLIKNNVVRRIK